MQIVIDISEEVYERFGYEYSEEHSISKCTNDIILDAFCTGIPLPKGHGKLKDENEIFECIRNRVENLKNDSQFIKYRKDIDLLGTIPHIRNEVRTIIEADTAESENKDADNN